MCFHSGILLGLFNTEDRRDVSPKRRYIPDDSTLKNVSHKGKIGRTLISSWYYLKFVTMVSHHNDLVIIHRHNFFNVSALDYASVLSKKPARAQSMELAPVSV
jgi:hypothetical protein